jgi:hypothetical protein
MPKAFAGICTPLHIKTMPGLVPVVDVSPFIAIDTSKREALAPPLVSFDIKLFTPSTTNAI